jgi:hypothetical protein
VALSIAPVAEGAGDGDRAAARRLGYPAAVEHLDKAYAVLHVPTIGLWLARSLAHSGKLVEAAERYLEVERLDPEGDAKVQKRAQQDAAKELVELNKRIPSLTIGLEGAAAADVKIALDGVSLASVLVNEARPVNPGKHTIVGTYGKERVESVVQVGEKERAVTKLTFHAPPEPERVAEEPAATTPAPAAAVAQVEPNAPTWNTGKSVAVALGVVGVAGIAFAAAEGVHFNDRKNAQINACPEPCIDVDKRNTADQANIAAARARTLMVIGGIAGGASLIAAGVVWFTAGNHENRNTAKLQWTPTVSAGGLGIGVAGNW